MRRSYLAIGLATLIGLAWAEQAQAQSPLYAPNPGPRITTFDFPPWGAGVPASDGGFPDTGLWGGAEYLIWWLQNSPIPVPLATVNVAPPATIGQPGTTILWGAGSGRDVGFGAFSGGRFTLGGWLGDRDFGLEASGFVLESRSVIFNSDAFGGTNSSLSVPFFAAQPPPGVESAIVATPFPNNISSTVTAQLWGAEGNGVLNLYEDGTFRLAALVGFRYLDLRENLSLTDAIFFLPTNGVLSITDVFNTQNQFYGGQLGLRGGAYYFDWTFDACFKIALGGMQETLNVAGFTRVTNGAFGLPNGTTPIGLFAEPSNIGTSTRSLFTVIPEFQCKVGYFVTPGIRPFVGYNVLFVNNVIRPGDQIDRNINTTQNPFIGGSGALVGPAFPLPRFNNSSFLAQGINLGIEFRY